MEWYILGEKIQKLYNSRLWALSNNKMINAPDCALTIEIPNYDKSKDELVRNAVMQVQESDLVDNLLKKLETLFPIKTSTQTKE